MCLCFFGFFSRVTQTEMLTENVNSLVDKQMGQINQIIVIGPVDSKTKYLVNVYLYPHKNFVHQTRKVARLKLGKYLSYCIQHRVITGTYSVSNRENSWVT